MTTDTSERGLEQLICTVLTGASWIGGRPDDYDREYCVDLGQLLPFLVETQPEAFDALQLEDDGPTRRKFLARLQGEISRRGTIDVLRHGIKHGPHTLDLFYGTPSPGNAKAAERFAANRFSVTRQLRYSRDETQRALDLGLFINGLPYTNAEWEKLSIFLTFLVPKLPAPIDEDLSKGILESIDMDSYRVEKRAAVKIQLPDADAEIEPVPTAGGGRLREPELDRLSNILKAFNDQFGNVPWTDTDRVHRLITEDIPNRVAADTAYQNARQHSDRQNARIEHDKALGRVMTAVLKDDTELFKQFMDNEGFRRWLTDTVFGLTYDGPSISQWLPR